MKKSVKKTFSLSLSLIVILSSGINTYAEGYFPDDIQIQDTEGYDDSAVTEDKTVDQTVSTDEKSDEANPDANDNYIKGTHNVDKCSYAKIVFENPIKSLNMSFEDGMGRADVSQGNVLYSELCEFDSVQARKFYKGNDLYIRMDESFFKPEDREFVFVIKYWDFGDGAGSVYVDYPIVSDSAPGRISIRKPGVEARWRTETIYVNNADFVKKMEYGSQIKIVTMGYNAFSEIYVINVSEAKENKNFVGQIWSAEKAYSLSYLGLWNFGTDRERLSLPVTAQDAIKGMIKSAGYEKKIAETSVRTDNAGISPENMKYISYARSKNIIDDKFIPQKEITVAELLEYYLCFLGYEKNEFIGELYNFAYSTGLITDKDAIYHIDTPLNFDKFAAIAYNAVLLKMKGERYSAFNNMIVEGSIKKETIDMLADINLIDAMYEIPTKIEITSEKDASTGVEINYLNISNGMTVLPYLTQTKWLSDSKRFIAASSVTGGIYEYNMQTGMLKYLDNCYINSMADATVTENDLMFYNKNNHEIWCMDLKTYDKRKVADLPEYVDLTNNVMTIQTTNDGKYLTCYWKENLDEKDFMNGKTRMRKLVRLNTETGVWETDLLSKEFDDLLAPEAGHPCINPENPDLVMFCHETAQSAFVDDRVWVGNYKTGESVNFFKEAIRKDGFSGEINGHEIWSSDGQDIYLCKMYNKTSTIGQAGIVRINIDGIEREYINDDFDYIHACVDKTQNFIAADIPGINGKDAIVALIDARTYKSFLLTSYPESNGNHPYHPHPGFSPDSTKVLFQKRNPNGILAAAWIDVSEYTGKNLNGGREMISENISLVSYEGAASEIEKVKYNGYDCFKTKKGSGIYLDYNDSTAYGLNGSMKISFKYLDKGYQPIKVYYTTGVKSPRDYCNRENGTVNIKRRNSLKWIEAEFTFDDVNLANACKFKSDIRIEGVQSEIYIRDIKMECK